LHELAGVAEPQRTARFRCVIAIATPGPAAPDFETRLRGCRVTLHEGRVEGGF
jgi:inosine/xanthosine triphosphate pyrophosphatase family protein